MHDNELYPIGDVARRTGLSVSAIRFYSDTGVIAPAELTGAGYRLYDIRAIAQLELVRTLRELDTGLEDIRRLLGGETTLHDLVAAHLEIIERQERGLRARRAVLRTLMKQGGTVEQAALMHKLVSMSDEERERLIDDFWNEISAGLDINREFVGRLREFRPQLPGDPTTEQLEAWIELADLAHDPEFREAVRAELQDTYSTPHGRIMATTPVQDFIHTDGAEIMEEILSAYRSGLPVDSPRAQEMVLRLERATAELAGRRHTAESLERMAARYLQIAEILREEAQEGADAGSRFDAPYGRYLSLVAMINGTPHGELDPAVFGWISAVLRALASGRESAAEVR
ncbi:MerR family transcriptional regulator [Marinactinospora rubrisoli]|uniref:MerR family transcriptional regulator n=1 Tax=Marinactinospora rubrisoli TaxID=2715399 RepID=A0ABW2KNK6_9ACTN